MSKPKPRDLPPARSTADGPVQPIDGGVLLHVLAFPKAGRNEIGNVRNGRVLVKVTAAPEDGKANAAIIKLLAKTHKLPLSDFELVSGVIARHKSIRIQSATAALVKPFLPDEES